MINAEQIRAARALLGWPTTELAKRTGLTVNGINKIERGHVVAQRDTLEKIQAVIENAGVEFLPGSGVRWKDRMVTVFEGALFRRLLMDDIYNTLKDSGGEFLIAHQYEDTLHEDMGLDFLKESLHRRKKAGIRHRLLVLEDDPGLFAPFDTYHVLDKKYFSPYPIHIYGSKMSLSSRQYAPKTIIIDNDRIAESARKLFEFVWDHTKDVPEKRQKTARTKKLYDYVWGLHKSDARKKPPSKRSLKWPEERKKHD